MNNISREKEKWNKQKSMGKKKFVLIYGVLLWGLCSAIVYNIVTIFISQNSTSYNIILFRLLISTIIFGLFGILIGIGQWKAIIKKIHDN